METGRKPRHASAILRIIVMLICENGYYGNYMMLMVQKLSFVLWYSMKYFNFSFYVQRNGWLFLYYFSF